MNSAGLARTRLTVTQDNIIHLPLGLLGFEPIKKYILLSDPEEQPFLWLQMLENPNHGFLVLSPEVLFPEYRPEISNEDVDFLDLRGAEDALILLTVTVRGERAATANLKGPIVLNRHTLLGKQVIPLNASGFSLEQPLPGLCQRV